ncbi:helix-turn-helix domain-containing protein [Nonomuraea indica]|uniref:helix-turn-helix domain-containing protein n=1 Tax=Nonomuraea indica TaxID=1581193 RepID=UPI000C7A9D42|nr:pyridoxamine 5'-phosphate oxidase family protein [Nonomuraea indica]
MSYLAGHLGGFGRRVAERREKLGLTRGQLAERAGVEEAYVGYLEEQSESAVREAATRLASALDTTTAHLLGEAPSGDEGGAAAGTHLDELDEEECLRLLSPGGVGRIAYNGRYGPTVLPVNYRVARGAVVFRTTAGGAMEADLRTGLEGVEYLVAFEVDRIEEDTRTGWSVLVQGSLHHVTDEELAEAQASGVSPWAGGDRRQYLRIAPARMTGRRISAD